MHEVSSQHMPLLPTQRPLPSTPRRVFAEADECPVCHDELPPKGPNGEEGEREAHVQECINSRFISAAGLSSAVAGPSTASPAGASASSAPANSGAGFASPHLRPTLQSTSDGRTAIRTAGMHDSRSQDRWGWRLGSDGVARRPRRNTGRLIAYTATEKDCQDGEGNAQECIICFEEFEDGDAMARLECLCKFHEVSRAVWALLCGSADTVLGVHSPVVECQRYEQVSDSCAYGLMI